MEPIHIYALLHTKKAEEIRQQSLEQYFVARDHARTARRERIRRLRRRFIGRGVPWPNNGELAVR